MLIIIDFLQSAMLHVFVFIFGCFLYTVGEFYVHNILCHHRKLKWASKIHWDHHKVIGGIEKAKLAADAYSNIATPVIAAAVLPIVWLLFSIFIGFEFGFTLALAFMVGYLHYEYVHWRVHCREPRNIYELKLLQHHFAHHYCDPKRYQSVSLPALDHYFGTMPAPEKQAEHFEKIKNREPLNSEGNLWARIHEFTSHNRYFPENFKTQYLNAQAH